METRRSSTLKLLALAGPLVVVVAGLARVAAVSGLAPGLDYTVSRYASLLGAIGFVIASVTLYELASS